MKRTMTFFLALAVEAVMGACVLSPADGSFVSSTTTPVTLAGYELDGGVGLTVTAYNVVTQTFQAIPAAATTSATSSSFTFLGSPLFYWTTPSFTIPSNDWQSGLVGSYARVVVNRDYYGSGFGLMTVSDNFYACADIVAARPGATIYDLTQCSSPNSPELIMRTTNYHCGVYGEVSATLSTCCVQDPAAGQLEDGRCQGLPQNIHSATSGAPSRQTALGFVPSWTDPLGVVHPAHIVVGYNDLAHVYPPGISGGVNDTFGWAWTIDGGQTWNPRNASNATVPYDTSMGVGQNHYVADTTLTVLNPGGSGLVAFAQTGGFAADDMYGVGHQDFVVVATSTDGGETFTHASDVSDGSIAPCRRASSLVCDQPNITTNTTDHSLWVTWRVGSFTGSGSYQLAVRRGTVDSAGVITWDGAGHLVPLFGMGTHVLGPEIQAWTSGGQQHIAVLGMTNTSGYSCHRTPGSREVPQSYIVYHSVDGGSTWNSSAVFGSTSGVAATHSQPVCLLNTDPPGDAFATEDYTISNGRAGNFRYDPSNDRLLVATNERNGASCPSGCAQTNLYALSMSAFGAATTAWPAIYSDATGTDAHWHFQPTIEISSSGGLALAFLDGDSHSMVNTVAITSLSGLGTDWSSPPMVLSQHNATSLAGHPYVGSPALQGSGGQLGDFFSLVSIPSSAAQPANRPILPYRSFQGWPGDFYVAWSVPSATTPPFVQAMSFGMAR